MADPKIGVHLITWGAENWHTGLAEAEELGYTACETFTRTAMEHEENPDEFKDILDDHDMKLSALYAGAAEGRFTDPDSREEIVAYNENVARLLAELGGEYIVFGPGERPEGGPSLEELRIAAETINEAGQRCYDLGVKPCVHPHMYTEFQDRVEVDVIMEETDEETIFLCPDSAHLHKAGMDPAEVIRDYSDRVAYAHLKDVTPEDDDQKEETFDMSRHDEALPIFCELGLGTVDFESVMEAYDDIDYDGWLTVEIDQSTSTPKQSLEICRNFVEEDLGIPVQGTVYR